MKYVIVTMVHGGLDEAAMQYPSVYNAVEVDRNKKGPIVYEGAFSRGEVTEECLLFLKDSVADTYALDPNIRIITEAEADTWLLANEQLKDVPDIRVTDPDKLLLVRVKQAEGIPLDKDDLRALDPDDVVLGVTRLKKTAAKLFG